MNGTEKELHCEAQANSTAVKRMLTKAYPAFIRVAE